MTLQKSNNEILIDILTKSPLINQIFNALDNYDDYEYFIGAGCIAQTVWNHKYGKPYDYGIKDIDFVYFNDSDLSLEAENRTVERIKKLLEPSCKEIDCKNQARVHLWYELKFGIKLAPYISLEDAISSWPTTASAMGVRRSGNTYKICAPYGLDDLLSGVIRANKKLITEDIFINKSSKWKEKWTDLVVIPW